MTTLAAWKPATAYAKGATVRPNATQGSVPVPIVNGNFNSGDTAWTKDAGWAISTGDAYEGTHKGIYTGAGAGTIKVSGTYPATAGQVITATIKAKVLDAADGATAFLKWYDASNVLISTTTGLESSVETGVWMQLTVVGQAPANTATVVFGVEATRTVGANVMIDDARWDYAAPIEARRLAYRAVQESAGVSGVVEPTWPTTLGARVNDGTVVWETVELDWIEWTARPILESGLTEPVWPTSVGGFVGDGTINWECTSRRVEDEKCPNTKVVAIISSKVFAADKDIIRFSATAMPLDWSSSEDAGYLPSGLQQANAGDMAVLYPYRGNLCAWNVHCFQMWQTDPDPSQMALLDQMDGVGSSYPLAARAVGNDLYYLSNRGVRSVGIANAAQNLQAGDVGMPIDLLVQAAAVQWAIDGKKALSTYWPGMGQYWLCGGDDGVTAGAGGALRLICAPPGGTLGDAYTYTYTATGGTAPYTYSVVSGTLPDGLTLDEETGVLSGTLAEAGSFSFGVQVRDALGVVAYCGWSAEVVEDEVEIAPLWLLVTGANKTGETEVWAAAEATASPTFFALDTADGADLANAVPAAYGNRFVVGSTDDARTITGAPTGEWDTIPLDSDGQVMYSLVGESAGWMGLAYGAEMVNAAHPPTTFVNYAPTSPHTSGAGGPWDMTSASINFKAGGYYYASEARNLYRSSSPTGPWETLHDQLSIVAAGDNPNGECIVAWKDAVKVDGLTYFITSFDFSLGTRRAQIRTSPDDGETLPDTDIILDVLFSSTTDTPHQLAAADGVVIAYCAGGGIRTSADNFVSVTSTGLAAATDGARKIATAGKRAYIIGSGATDGDKCVVYNTLTQTMGSPITMPIRSAVGIAIGGGS